MAHERNGPPGPMGNENPEVMDSLFELPMALAVGGEDV